MMISCQYCGFSHAAFQPTCSACGAPLPVETNPAAVRSDPQAALEKIRSYCRQSVLMYTAAGAADLFHDGSSIPKKKIPALQKSFDPFPHNREIYFYCDTGPLNNGKQGFMICEDGIYWKNGWLKPSSRNFLSWDQFRDREIALKHYDLSLGHGDSISLAGIGRKVVFPIIEGIFQRIQIILKGN